MSASRQHRGCRWTHARRESGSAWSRFREVCQEYLKKGSLVYLEGWLKTDKYEDKDDETRYYIKVVALGLQFLDKKDKEEPELTIEEEASDYEA